MTDTTDSRRGKSILAVTKDKEQTTSASNQAWFSNLVGKKFQIARIDVQAIFYSRATQGTQLDTETLDEGLAVTSWETTNG